MLCNNVALLDDRNIPVYVFAANNSQTQIPVVRSQNAGYRCRSSNNLAISPM